MGDVLTINMAQGQEMTQVIIDADSFFEFGSMYTAISRTKRWADVYILKRGDYTKTF